MGLLIIVRCGLLKMLSPNLEMFRKLNLLLGFVAELLRVVLQVRLHGRSYKVWVVVGVFWGFILQACFTPDHSKKPDYLYNLF